MRIFSKDTEMELGIDKSVMLIMKGRKREITEGIEQLNQELIRMLGEKENYKSLMKG